MESLAMLGLAVIALALIIIRDLIHSKKERAAKEFTKGGWFVVYNKFRNRYAAGRYANQELKTGSLFLEDPDDDGKRVQVTSNNTGRAVECYSALEAKKRIETFLRALEEDKWTRETNE